MAAASSSSSSSHMKRVFLTYHQICAFHQIHDEASEVSAASSSDIGGRPRVYRRHILRDFPPALAEENLRNCSISDPSSFHVSLNHYYVLMRDLREHGYIAEASVILNRCDEPDTTSGNVSSRENNDQEDSTSTDDSADDDDDEHDDDDQHQQQRADDDDRHQHVDREREDSSSSEDSNNADDMDNENAHDSSSSSSNTDADDNNTIMMLQQRIRYNYNNKK
jgi:hypothetical protein